MSQIMVEFNFGTGYKVVNNLDENFKLVKNFALWELANTSAKEQVKMVITPRSMKFLIMLQELRDWYKKPITINSNYRTKSFNASCKGDSKSRHLEGEAADLGIPNLTDLQRKHFADKWKAICIKYGEIGAINFYTGGLHVEIGSDKSYGNKEFKIRDYRKTSSDW